MPELRRASVGKHILSYHSINLHLTPGEVKHPPCQQPALALLSALKTSSLLCVAFPLRSLGATTVLLLRTNELGEFRHQLNLGKT